MSFMMTLYTMITQHAVKWFWLQTEMARIIWKSHTRQPCCRRLGPPSNKMFPTQTGPQFVQLFLHSTAMWQTDIMLATWSLAAIGRCSLKMQNWQLAMRCLQQHENIFKEKIMYKMTINWRLPRKNMNRLAVKNNLLLWILIAECNIVCLVGKKSVFFHLNFQCNANKNFHNWIGKIPLDIGTSIPVTNPY